MLFPLPVDLGPKAPQLAYDALITHGENSGMAQGSGRPHQDTVPLPTAGAPEWGKQSRDLVSPSIHVHVLSIPTPAPHPTPALPVLQPPVMSLPLLWGWPRRGGTRREDLRGSLGLGGLSGVWIRPYPGV